MSVQLKSSKLEEALSKIRSPDKNCFFRVEIYESYLYDIFNFFSSKQKTEESSKNNTAKHTVCKGSFLKYLNGMQSKIAEKLFDSIDKNSTGSISLNEYKEFMIIIKFGELKPIAELFFNIFVSSNKMGVTTVSSVSLSDIKFLLNFIPYKFSYGYIETQINKNSQEKESLEYSSEYIDYLLDTTFGKEASFDKNNFIEAVCKSHEFFLFLFSYLYESIPGFNKNLVFYKYKESRKKSIKSESTAAFSTFSSKSIYKMEESNISTFIDKEDTIRNLTFTCNSMEKTDKFDLLSHSNLEEERKVKSYQEVIKKDLITNSCLSPSSPKEKDPILKENAFENFNTDDNFVFPSTVNDLNNNYNNYYNNVEYDLKKNIITEVEVYINDDKSKSNYSTKPTKYTICLIEDILYIYENFKGNYENYKNVYFLNGANLKENSKITNNSTIYHSFTLFFLNDSKETFFLKNEKKAIELKDAIRTSFNYRNYFKDYKLISELGEGTYGKVFKTEGINYNSTQDIKSSNENSNTSINSNSSSSSNFSATKIINKPKDEKGWYRIKTEIDILKRADHPNIIKYKDSYENSEFYFILLEYVNYGTLTKYMNENKGLGEKKVAKVIKQVAKSIHCLHNLGIIHRDLKPDNILVSDINSDKEIKIKLSDFGLAIIINANNDETIKESCGSIPFCAPEILNNQEYNQRVDIWALGIITHFFLTENFPFRMTKDKKKLMKNICSVKEYNFSEIRKKSSECYDFIKKCLAVDVQKRLNIEEVCNHPWLNQN